MHQIFKLGASLLTSVTLATGCSGSAQDPLSSELASKAWAEMHNNGQQSNGQKSNGQKSNGQKSNGQKSNGQNLNREQVGQNALSTPTLLGYDD
jgi:hypothetical protein